MRNRSAPAGVQVRTTGEIRAEKTDGGGMILKGYASVTETPYDMWDFAGQYREIIANGAFERTLAQNPDVVLLVNHAGLPLASTRGPDGTSVAATLGLGEDSRGLAFEARLGPEADAADVWSKVDRGVVRECSFAFRMAADGWEWRFDDDNHDNDTLTITECNLNRGDVSVVTYGANPATSVQVRMALQHPQGREWLRKELGDAPVDRAAMKALLENADWRGHRSC